jgi:CheY-like chemotaxis protein
LLNLLSNAYKFTESEGTIEIYFDEEKIDDKIILNFTVSDTGCGIDEDLHKRLFNKFEQQDATTVRKYGGSGLGLSICSSLVSLMDGKISVESKKNVGTKFKVSIPLGISKNSAIIPIKDVQDLNALIINPYEENCKYLSSILDKWNMDNECCSSSVLAMDKIQNKILNKKGYSLYIIDIDLDIKKGIEFRDKLKKIVNDDSIPMFITGYDFNEAKLISNDFELSNFIRKPVFASELYSKIISKIKLQKETKKEFNEMLIDLKGINVLVVEDNKMNQLIASRIIEKKGATVHLCNNGLEAVECVKKQEIEYDVIFMDVQMPVMDGYEATRVIRKLNSVYAKNIKIYAMTANSFNSDVEKSKDSGMNGHISKPIDTKVLFRLLANIKKNK